MRKLPIFTALFLIAVFPSFAQEKIDPVKFDFSRKDTSPQRVILPIKLASSEELDSLRLDMTLDGVECKQTEGQAGLLSGKLSTYRFGDTVEIEIRLGRDDGKPMLLIKPYAISKTDKGKEKRVAVSLVALDASVAKLDKTVLESTEKASVLEKKYLQVSTELRDAETQIDSLEREMSLAPENQRGPYESKLGSMRANRASLFRQKNITKESLSSSQLKVRNSSPLLKNSKETADTLREIQSKASLKFRAHARINGTDTVVAETR